MLKPTRPAQREYRGNFTDSTRWASFAPRSSDVIVITPPKSGTTWTQAILALLISGDPDVDAETSMKSPWIDFNIRDNAEVMARLEAQEHRRQVKTHTSFDGIPYWAELRYIAVYRHPIDVYFSFRKHAHNQIEKISRSFFPEAYFSDDPADGFREYLEGEFVEAASLKAVVDHYLATLAMEPAENILRLHYADMLRDLDGAFQRISAHVGLSHPPDLMSELVNAATFESMKASAHRFTPSAGQGIWHNDSGFFDSASSNKWEGRLSERDLADYDARVSAMLSPAERRWLEWGSV